MFVRRSSGLTAQVVREAKHQQEQDKKKKKKKKKRFASKKQKKLEAELDALEQAANAAHHIVEQQQMSDLETDLNSLSKPDLRKFAKELGIPKYQKTNAADLIQLILAAHEDQEDDEQSDHEAGEIEADSDDEL